MKEIWKEVTDYNVLYQVSNMGYVRRNGKILKSSPNHKGYLMVNLYLNGKRKNHKVHRLVATAFISNPENKPTVNHKDGNKQNNVIANVEWATYSENNLHAYRVLGRNPAYPMKGRFGEDNPISIPFHIKYPDGIVVRYAGGREFTRKTGFNHKIISWARIKKGLPYQFKQGKMKGLEVSH